MVIIFISKSYYHYYYIRHDHHTNSKSVVRRPSRLATALWCYPSELRKRICKIGLPDSFVVNCKYLAREDSVLGLVIKRGGASTIVHWSHLWTNTKKGILRERGRTGRGCPLTRRLWCIWLAGSRPFAAHYLLLLVLSDSARGEFVQPC